MMLNQKKVFKYVGIFSALVVILGICTYCYTNSKSNKNVNKKITIMLDWTPNTNHTGLYVAKHKHFFEQEGLPNVDIIESSGAGCIDVVAIGKAEFGISYQEEVTYARTSERAFPIKAIAAIVQHNTSGFASLKSKNIISPVQFQGKRYGSWGSESEIAILKTVMEHRGADFRTVKVVNIPSLDFISAYKDVDFSWIYYGWSGIAAKVKNIDINFIKLTDLEPELECYTPVIICSDNLAREQREMVKNFLKAVKRGYSYCTENPIDAANILLENVPGLNKVLVQESQKYISGQYVDISSKWGKMEEGIWETYGKWMYNNGLIKKKLNVKEAFSNEYL